MTLAQTLAAFVSGAKVPEEARAAALIAIADCIGCMVAGADTDAVRRLATVLESRSGPASILGMRRTASVREAALLNGTAAHALDYDDISWSLYGHPSVVVLPPLMALAEAEGRSAEELLDAYAVAVEVAAKLGRWANPQLYLHGWHATAALGVLGSAAGAARLLDLPQDKVALSLSIAASLAAGIRRNFGSMVKPLHAGRAAEAAVLAVQLARAGFTADIQALDGRFGYFDVIAGRPAPASQEITAVLGQPWETVEPGIVLKRYPSCGATHCALDGLLELREDLAFSAADVEAIECGAEPLALKVLQHARPATGLEGKFSMQFCLAVAVVDGAPGLRHFDERWIRDPAVQALIGRISVVDRPDFGGASNDAVPASVKVRLKDGRSAERTVTVPRGDPRRPLSEEERYAKFTDCTQAALGGDADACWHALQTLGRSGDLPGLLERLRGGAEVRSAAYG